MKSKKFWLTIALLLSITKSAFALIELKSNDNFIQSDINVTSFNRYPPFGEYIVNGEDKAFHSVFKKFIEKFGADNLYKINYITDKNYNILVRDVRRGEIDIILGAYFETEQYRGLEIIYPSLIDNPITVAMPLSLTKQIKSMNDLKNFRGGINKKEHLSDYVKKQIHKYKVKEFDNSYELYKALFIGEIDFVFTSQYFGIIETAKLGIREQISFATQTLWKMPLFVGVSKTSKYRKDLVRFLTRAAEDPNTQKQIQEEINKTLKETEERYKGVVPPNFIK